MPRENDKGKAESQNDRKGRSVPNEPRDATEPEIDEAVDESFPASDPPALHLEKDR